MDSRPLPGGYCRPMFRFGIRDVLWLTFAVAMGLGCWLDRRAVLNAGNARSALIQREAEAKAKKLEHELVLWKFRAETLAKDIERSGGNVSTQNEGTEVFMKVRVHTLQGEQTSTHYLNRGSEEHYWYERP